MVMKNTDRLEEFVREHRNEFDPLEPSPELWSQIEKNTAKGKVIKLRKNLFRVTAAAAVIVLLVTAVNLTFLRNNKFSRSADPEISDLLDTERYYAQKVNGKLKEIQKCYATYPDIKNEVETDLMELETMYNTLKNDLRENVSNKSVIEAMIENNRFRLKLVDSVLEQVEC